MILGIVFMGKNMSKARLKVYFTRFSGSSITECESCSADLRDSSRKAG